MFLKCVCAGFFVIFSLILSCWYSLLSLHEVQKLTLKMVEKRLKVKIKRKLISSIFIQLKSLSLKKSDGYFKVYEESQEVHSIVSKQKWKMHVYISYDVLVAFGR